MIFFCYGFSDWKENYNNNPNLFLRTSCNNQNVNNNNYHHHHQQPKLENFLGRHSFGDHDHHQQTYGGNSASGDYMFPNFSLQLPAEGQPEATGAVGGG